jgi:hypothetical protein
VAIEQGDQIGRYFAFWVFVFYGNFFSKITKGAKILRTPFPVSKIMHSFRQKNTLGRFFSHTRLVTLLLSKPESRSNENAIDRDIIRHLHDRLTG